MDELLNKVIDLYDGKLVTVIGMNVLGEIWHEFDVTGVAHVRIAPQPKNPFFPDAPTQIALINISGDDNYESFAIHNHKDFELISNRIVIHE